MKKNVIVVFAAASMMAVACASQKKAVVTYTFPDQMLAHVKTEYTKMCEKGQILYELNCAKCHNVVVKRKEIIPDFDPDRLIGYEIRVTNETHESELPDEQVTPEELEYIMTFLNYKTKTGIQALAPKEKQ